MRWLIRIAGRLVLLALIGYGHFSEIAQMPVR